MEEIKLEEWNARERRIYECETTIRSNNPGNIPQTLLECKIIDTEWWKSSLRISQRLEHGSKIERKDTEATVMN
jgi:hypothetical protein